MWRRQGLFPAACSLPLLLAALLIATRGASALSSAGDGAALHRAAAAVRAGGGDARAAAAFATLVADLLRGLTNRTDAAAGAAAATLRRPASLTTDKSSWQVLGGAMTRSAVAELAVAHTATSSYAAFAGVAGAPGGVLRLIGSRWVGLLELPAHISRVALVVSSAGYPCIAFVVARKQGGEALAARCPGLGLDGEVPLAPAASAAHTTIDAVALALDAHHRPVIAATYTAVGVRAAAVRAYSPASRSWAAVGQPLPAWGADLALAVAPDGAALVALADSRHGGALSLLRCDSLAASGWEELGSGVSVGAALAIRLALRPGGAGGDVLAAWMDDAEGLGAAEYGAASGTWRQLGAAPSVAADWVPLEGGLALGLGPEGAPLVAVARYTPDLAGCLVSLLQHNGSSWALAGGDAAAHSGVLPLARVAGVPALTLDAGGAPVLSLVHGAGAAAVHRWQPQR
ncbi:Cellulosome-anchoring precursor [Micractinium conductrix]|uniref:Cellulosome-anchoring n=1 Tax=Micractinium conductrix TaxID=554055 RepID=A0A2P6VI00_9CHLO|nr:Cellulosome-anchoring precursor [Micractinium conductrix]|eukprot:PSC73723.1 Cellulosome-anchoring precursor [Micractinium conductrix]